MPDPYVYSGTHTLINKLNIRDPNVLEIAERTLVAQRQIEGVPRGHFDAQHLQAIHHYLFQDVYEWAGEFRSVHMSKGGTQFQFPEYLDTGLSHVHSKVENYGYLHDTSRADFAVHAADIIGDLNYAHPFREGNGRTQLQYLKQLGEQAGHEVDISALQGQQWIHASIESYHTNLTPMQTAIHGAIEPEPPHDQAPHMTVEIEP